MREELYGRKTKRETWMQYKGKILKDAWRICLQAILQQWTQARYFNQLLIWWFLEKLTIYSLFATHIRSKWTGERVKLVNATCISWSLGLVNGLLSCSSIRLSCLPLQCVCSVLWYPRCYIRIFLSSSTSSVVVQIWEKHLFVFVCSAQWNFHSFTKRVRRAERAAW